MEPDVADCHYSNRDVFFFASRSPRLESITLNHTRNFVKSDPVQPQFDIKNSLIKLFLCKSVLLTWRSPISYYALNRDGPATPLFLR